VREVNAYLGWFGGMSRPLQAFSAAGAVAMAVPGARALAEAATKRFVKGSTGGPSEAERAAGAASYIGLPLCWCSGPIWSASPGFSPGNI
jgi:hypothetical protein